MTSFKGPKLNLIATSLCNNNNNNNNNNQFNKTILQYIQ